MAAIQHPARGFQIGPGHRRHPFACEIERSDDRRGLAALRQCLERRQLIAAIDRRDNDPLFACCDQFGIHHDARDSAIAIDEWMHL